MKVEEVGMRGNGKVDVKGLGGGNMEGGERGYEGGREEVERVVWGIWEEVVGVREVGIEDEFLLVGGD